jgi:hypothetical protein
MSESKGLRYNEGKLRWSLLQWKALVEVLKVTEMGAEKYSPRNWEKGLSYSDTYDSAQRHLVKWYLKEDNDEESKLSHLAHAAWNCLTLLEFELNRESYKSFDDRGKEVIKSAETKFVNTLEINFTQLNKQISEQLFANTKINNIFNLHGVEYKISGPKLFAGSMTPCHCEICQHEIRREENVVELHGGESRKFLHNRCLEANEQEQEEISSIPYAIDLSLAIKPTARDLITIYGKDYNLSNQMTIDSLTTKQAAAPCVICHEKLKIRDSIVRLLNPANPLNNRMIHIDCLTLANLKRVGATGYFLGINLVVRKDGIQKIIDTNAPYNHYEIKYPHGGVDDNDLKGLC